MQQLLCRTQSVIIVKANSIGCRNIHTKISAMNVLELDMDLKFVEWVLQLQVIFLVLYQLIMEIQTKEILIQYFTRLLLLLSKFF